MRATRQGPQQKWGVNLAAGEPTIHRNYTSNILTVTICSQMVSSSCFLCDTRRVANNYCIMIDILFDVT